MKEKKRLEELFSSLSPEEKRALSYFIQNISVGEIAAVRELEVVERVENAKKVIDALIEKGLIERGVGCYNLARSLREKLEKDSKAFF